MHTSVIQIPDAGRRRGRYSDEFKRQVMAACKQPGVSTAAVALANGLNANLLRRWISESRVRAKPAARQTKALALSAQSQFIPMELRTSDAAYLFANARGNRIKVLVHDGLGICSALEQLARIYDIEREIKELLPDERRRIRQERTKPLLEALHQWMILNRQKITDGTATAKAINYSLRRWGALTRFVEDGQLLIDNNYIENQIRPIAIGRNNAICALMRSPQFSQALVPSSKGGEAAPPIRIITVPAGTPVKPLAVGTGPA